MTRVDVNDIYFGGSAPVIITATTINIELRCQNTRVVSG